MFLFSLGVLLTGFGTLAGVSLHRMHDVGQWLLLPEDAIIRQYYNALTLSSDGVSWVADRETFPDIAVRSFDNCSMSNTNCNRKFVGHQ